MRNYRFVFFAYTINSAQMKNLATVNKLLRLPVQQSTKLCTWNSRYAWHNTNTLINWSCLKRAVRSKWSTDWQLSKNSALGNKKQKISSSRSGSSGLCSSVVIPGNVIFIFSPKSSCQRPTQQQQRRHEKPLFCPPLVVSLFCYSFSHNPVCRLLPPPFAPSQAPMLGLTLGISLINCYAYIRSSGLGPKKSGSEMTWKRAPLIVTNDNHPLTLLGGCLMAGMGAFKNTTLNSLSYWLNKMSNLFCLHL